MEKYGTTPVATDLFLDTKRYPDRWLTLDEQIASFHRDIDIAVRLGATVVRAIINTPPEVMEGAAPYAEAKGVRLLLEVHAPFHYEHPWILAAPRGHAPDRFAGAGPHARHGHLRASASRAWSASARSATAPSPSWSTCIVKTYDDHGDTHALMDIVNYRDGGPVDIGLARQATHYIWTEPKSMLEHMPLIGHIQAKFYEMTDAGGRVLDPVRRDRPGAHRGRLRRLPVQRVRGQPAHPGRLPGRQRRAGPPPARHVRPPAREEDS